MIDTPPTRGDTRSRALILGLLLGLVAFPLHASAQGQDARVSVVWARRERVVLAAADTLTLEPGGRLSFLERGRTVATGEVTRVVDRDIAVARLTSGSLARVKKLERLRVLFEPPRMPARSMLRLGVPGPGRANLLFRCEGLVLDAASPARGYRTDALVEHGYRLVRGTELTSSAPWPDTLLLRLFDEAADEEIALERGELDAGVFWPGELSSHMREDPRWRPPLMGVRARGALAAIESVAGTGDDASAALSDSLAFAALNRELFRGDLAPWGPAQPARGDTRGSSPARYLVDPSLPGQRALQVILNRGAAPPPARAGSRTVEVAYLDVSIGSPDSLALAAAARAHRGAPATGARGDSTRVRCVLAVGCPLVCAPDFRSRLEALGTDALVNLLACPPAGRAP